MPADPGIVTSGTGPANAVVEIQPGMLVRAVVLIDQNGHFVPLESPVTTLYLATQGQPVYIAGGSAPTVGQVLVATGGNAATWQNNPAGFADPMTTGGDIIFENGVPAPARLAGNTATTKEFLTSTGSGGTANAPAWGALASGDIPANAANTSGTATTALVANALADSGGSVSVLAAPAPSVNQVLTATSGSTATWQFSPGGSTTTAGYLATTTTPVYTGGAAVPSAGQELIAVNAGTATWQNGAGAVLTTLGDTLYENATPALARLAGNTGTQVKFLSQTGNGTVSAAPAWSVVSGMYLCAPTQYAPASQVILGVVDGSFAVPGLSATVASGSNGGTISAVASWSSPSAGVFDVASTTGFPASGTLHVSASGSTVGVVTYAGTSGGNSFTGCAYVSGSPGGTVATNGSVVLAGAAALITTGPFTAPASGDVVVIADGLVTQFTTTSNAIGWALLGHGTSTQYGDIIVCPTLTANNRYLTPLRFLVTGLTPGSSYQFDLAAIVSLGQTLSIYAFGSASASPNLSGATANGAPVVMTVQAV